MSGILNHFNICLYLSHSFLCGSQLETHLLNTDHRKFKEHGHTNLENPSLFLRERHRVFKWFLSYCQVILVPVHKTVLFFIHT